MSLAPTSWSYWNTLGVAQYRAKDYTAAIASLEKSQELSDGENISHNGWFLAMAHAQLGEKEEARQWYEKAITWMDAHRPYEELQSFRYEAEQLLEPLDLAPQPSRP